MLERLLGAAGFDVHRVTFSEPGTADIDNLYARIGTEAPHLVFAGHTDVVPPGDEAAWTLAPFAGEVKDGMLYGRGTVDMKGGIACSVAAVLDYLAANGGKPKGSISFLITGDEEDVAVNGTIKLLKWAAERGEKFDHCVLGEPSNVEELGDCIKVGRRGSLSGTLIVDGKQGHVAYPDRAANPLPDISALITRHRRRAARPRQRALSAVEPRIRLDRRRQQGLERDPGAGARPLQHPLQRPPHPGLAEGAGRGARGKGRRQPHPPAHRVGAVQLERVHYQARPVHRACVEAIHEVTGRKPDLNTGGGTSDARFISHYCPVLEFGLVGQTMHQVDERVAVNDLERLTKIYRGVLDRYFA